MVWCCFGSEVGSRFAARPSGGVPPNSKRSTPPVWEVVLLLLVRTPVAGSGQSDCCSWGGRAGRRVISTYRPSLVRLQSTRTPRAARVGWRRLRRSERTFPVVGHPFGQGAEVVAAVEAAEEVQPLRGRHPRLGAGVEAGGVLEDGLREEVAFDDVVVRLVQAAAVGGEGAESGGGEPRCGWSRGTYHKHGHCR